MRVDAKVQRSRASSTAAGRDIPYENCAGPKCAGPYHHDAYGDLRLCCPRDDGYKLIADCSDRSFPFLLELTWKHWKDNTDVFDVIISDFNEEATPEHTTAIFSLNEEREMEMKIGLEKQMGGERINFRRVEIDADKGDDRAQNSPESDVEAVS